MRFRRLMIVASVCLLLLAGAIAAVFVHNAVLKRQALECRQRGMVAAEAGDSEVALDQVGRYLQQFGRKSDIEALLVYAKARRDVPLPNRKHLEQSASFLRQILELQPEHIEAQHELLGVYSDIGYGVETESLAKEILKKRPDDVYAMKALSKVYLRMQKYPDALELTKSIASLAPEDVENHILALTTEKLLKKPESEIIGYPATIQALSTSSAEFLIVQAIAYETVGDRGQTIEWATRAAAIPTANMSTVEFIDKLLIHLAATAPAKLELKRADLEMLARSSSLIPDITLKRLLISRLLESGSIRAVERIMEQAPLDTADSPTLGMLAMAYAKGEKWDQIKKIVHIMETRQDRAAGAWREILSVFYLGKKIADRSLLENCKKYVEFDAQSPYFAYFLAKAYERNLDSDLALRTCSEAAQLAPLWGEPLLLGAQILLAKGNSPAAAILARQALYRSPSDVFLAAEAAEIPGVDIDVLSDVERNQLWDLVEKVQSVKPMEVRTLPLLISFLSRKGEKSLAADKIKLALTEHEDLTESKVLRLAKISGDFDLGQTDACYAYALKTFGNTPGLALAQALAAYKASGPLRGLESLTAAAHAGGDTPDWKLAIAQYHEQTGSREAAAAWAAYAESVTPKTALALSRVLESNAAWKDPALIENTLKDLEELSGTTSYTWRVAKARWLLQTDTSEKATAEAVVLLQDSSVSSGFLDIRQYRLMAKALERIGNSEGAESNLEAAVRLEPRDNHTRLALARLLQTRGNTSDACAQLDEILASGQKSDSDFQRVCAMRAMQEGRADEAIKYLLATGPNAGSGQAPDILLAELYRIAGDLPNAEQIAGKLVSDDPSLPNVIFALDLFGSQGLSDRAKAAFEALARLQLEPSARTVIEADYSGYYGNADEAEGLYKAAIETDKGNVGTWWKRIASLIRAGNTSDALDITAEALAACPNEPQFRAIDRDRGLIEESAKNSLAQPIIASAMQDSRLYDAARQTLELLNQTPQDDPLRRLKQIERLIQTQPTYLPARMLLVRLYGQAGKNADAASTASKAMLDFPDQVEPAVLATDAFTAAGNWSEAFDADREALRRYAPRPRAGELLNLAGIQRIGRLYRADQAILPYASLGANDRKTDGQRGIQAIPLSASAKQIEDAEAKIAPRLNDSAAARMLWVRIASLRIASEENSATLLDRVSTSVPEGAADERTALALGWIALSDRTGNKKYLANARGLLESVISFPAVNVRAFLALASIAEQEQDFAKAEADYMRVPENERGQVGYTIGLANLYCAQSTKLDEAVRLAQKAVAAEPKNAGHYETLSKIYAAKGDRNSALKYLMQAIEIDPSQLGWRTRLREMQDASAVSATTPPPASTPIASGA